MTTSTSAPTATPPAKPPRVPVIDWLRGIAVITMIVAHSFDAWLIPAERVGFPYAVVRHVSGVPSRLFLFLVGVSSAAIFEQQLARGLATAEMRRQTFRRGFQMLAFAYLFRLQEHILAGFWGGWKQVFRVDILNCIAMSILLIAVVGVPSNGRPRRYLPLVVAALLIGFGPIIGPAHFPDYLPEPLTSYIGGQRPMSWFPLFPWGSWALVGLVVGHLWLAESRKPDRGLRCFLIGGALGALSLSTVLVIRAVKPNIIRYPSELIAQMGPGSFFFRIGVIALIALAGFLYTRWQTERAVGRPPRLRFLTVFGQTSLFVYWIHVEICYGFAARPIQKKLDFLETTIAFVLLTAVMFGLSLLKIRYGKGITTRLRGWFPRRPGGASSTS
ncbi:MAG TPA: heparan-alpha-glucosaminide N-acetyltransferase domain-containing protein [Polyangia bacterium]